MNVLNPPTPAGTIMIVEMPAAANIARSHQENVLFMTKVLFSVSDQLIAIIITSIAESVV